MGYTLCVLGVRVRSSGVSIVDEGRLQDVERWALP